VFIPPKIRNYFDLKAGDLLKFDIMEQRIVIKFKDVLIIPLRKPLLDSIYF